ncbi:MAG: AraC family transcriptional regulator [Burkholderiales bacterium]|nr:AraC family transcriptional regulator [Burkholderiales bacterium]
MDVRVRAGGLQGYVALMDELGADPRPLLRRHGLGLAQLADEDAQLPLAAVLDLMEDSARLTGCDDFGLRLARRQDISQLGPVALAMQNCPSVADALDCLARYLFVQSPGIAMSLHRPGQPGAGTIDLRYHITAPGRQFPRQAYDQGMAVAHHMLGLLAGSRYRLLAVSLPFRPEASLQAHARCFGARIHADRPYCALHVDAACLDAPVRAANPALLRVATAYLTAHFPGPQQRVAPRVRLALSHALVDASTDKAAIAAALAMHPRTLQRRLEAEGTSFDAIREELRHRHVLHYLSGTRLPLAQVAALLGFSEQSALTRYCRRRFGRTPSAIRAGADG